MHIAYLVLLFAMIPIIIFAIVAQIMVHASYNKYYNQPAQLGKEAHEVTEELLVSEGMLNISVDSCSGTLTDHFNPHTNLINLSTANYASNSISAYSIAAHEVGHAIQRKNRNILMIIRSFLGKTIRFSSFLTIPLIIIGLILGLMSYAPWGFYLVFIGVAIYGLYALMALITLPLELNASKRAYDLLLKYNLITHQEGKAVKKVLRGAAFTYLADLLISITTFLSYLIRILLIFKKD